MRQTRWPVSLSTQVTGGTLPEVESGVGVCANEKDGNTAARARMRRMGRFMAISSWQRWRARLGRRLFIQEMTLDWKLFLWGNLGRRSPQMSLCDLACGSA